MITENLTDMKLATPVSEGWLFSKDDEDCQRIFAGYDVVNQMVLLMGVLENDRCFQLQCVILKITDGFIQLRQQHLKDCVIFFDLCHFHF